MENIQILSCFWVLLMIFITHRFAACAKNTDTKRPNFVIFVADDFGYGDLSSYGHPSQEEGAADRMAREGMRLTQMYSPSPYCTPSRASLLTGRLPGRSGMYGPTDVLLPCHSVGLPKSEVTIAESLKKEGYRTGMVGKWHLGINERSYGDGAHLPQKHGFDYVGTLLPFSLAWSCDTEQRHEEMPYRSWCFLYYNDTIVQQPIFLSNLSSAISYDASSFISDTADDSPFFLYVALPQTHAPMFNRHDFVGKSKRGIYGDQVNEMNMIIGNVMDGIEKMGQRENTVSVFISDHGPQMELCEEAGDPGPFIGGKGYFVEGGLRVPAIVHWPGRIKPGTNTAAVSLMDLYPTIIKLAGLDIPEEQQLDGRDISSILMNESQETPHQIMFFYCDSILVAVRYKQYKVYFYHLPITIDEIKKASCTATGTPTVNLRAKSCDSFSELEEPWVYDVERDPREEYELNYVRPEIYEEVKELIYQHNQTMVMSSALLEWKYCDMNLIPCCNPPYCMCNYQGKSNSKLSSLKRCKPE